MTLGKTIIIIGEIGSGKTTIAKHISKKLGYTYIGFGEYLKSRFKKTPSRQELQDFGNSLINESPSLFLKNVIAHTTSHTDRILFDGVRHLTVFNEINLMSASCASIYMEATYEQRLYRYFHRSKEMDMMKYQSIFEKASGHDVEQETKLLRSKCDAVIISSDNIEEDIKEADRLLGVLNI